MRMTMITKVVPEHEEHEYIIDLEQEAYLSHEGMVRYSNDNGCFWFSPNTMKAFSTRLGGGVYRVIGPTEAEQGWLFCSGQHNYNRTSREYGVSLFKPDGSVGSHPEYRGKDLFPYSSMREADRAASMLAGSYKPLLSATYPHLELVIKGAYEWDDKEALPIFHIYLHNNLYNNVHDVSILHQPRSGAEVFGTASRITAHKYRLKTAKMMNR